MAKTLRVSEQWFRRGLWLVALVFAGFLIGLGGLVVDDLPQVETQRPVESFIESAQAQRVQHAMAAAHAEQEAASTAQDNAQLAWEQARTQYQSTRESFNTWVATRTATARPEQDAELMARSRALDVLKAAENQARQALEVQRTQSLRAQQALRQAEQEWQGLLDQAHPQWLAAQRASELRVFLYRLALTLPLLLVAGWLLVKHRKGTWWPFVWGFVFFAAFAFFVELVPYLPSYGGYVRYLVGIVITVWVGRWAIMGLQRYLERQRQAEALPAAERRVAMTYDAALAHLSKGVCPGCERPVPLTDGVTDFCPHCGIGLFDHCGHCQARKSAFARFCASCGQPAHTSAGTELSPTASLATAKPSP